MKALGGERLNSHLEQLVTSGQYVAALRLFENLIRDDNLPPGPLAKAHHLASVAAYATGQHYSAKQLAERAEQLAITAGDGDLLGRVWQNLTEFQRVCGDAHLAVDYGEKWLRNLAMYPDLAYRAGRVHTNLAWAHRTAGNTQNSLQHFKQAIELLRREHETCSGPGQQQTASWLASAIQMASWLLYELGDIEEGDRFTEEAGAYIHADDTKALREQLLLKCFRHFQLQEFETMRQLAEEFLSAEDLSTPIQRFWCLWMLGMAYAEARNLEAAQLFADLTTNAALELKEPRFMNKAGQLQKSIRARKANQAG